MSEFKSPLPCQYADALVAYMYEEIGGKEKFVFENHLANCSTCADELAEFSAVRFSIGEWRKTEFEQMATPIIFIPELAKSYPKIESIEVGKTPSLLAQIRVFFGLSPAWMSAMAAALVVCVGLILTVSYFRTEPQIARKEEKAVTNTVSETNSSLENQTDKIAETTENFEESKPPSTVSEKIGAQNIKVVRFKNSDIKEINPLQTKEKRVNRKPSAKPASNRAKSPSPTLIADEDDYEEDSLRLADLFREVGGG